MKRTFSIILDNFRTSEGSGTYILALLTMVIIPIYHWYLPPFMALWCILFLLELRNRRVPTLEIDSKHRILFILFMLFFTWQLVGMLYTSNSKGGWRNIELRIPLLIFPVLLVSPWSMIRQGCKFLFRLFALSTFIFLLICYGYALYRSIDYNNGVLVFNPVVPVFTWLNYFFGLQFAIFQHTSYLSMFTLFSVFVSLEAFFDQSLVKTKRYFWLIISIILITSIYFLSARAMILASIILIPLYLFQKFRYLWKSRFLGFGIVILILLFLTISLTNPRVNNYFMWRSGKDLGDIAIKDQRLVIWQSVSNLIRRNLIFGVGTGDIQDELDKEYIINGDKSLAEANTNAHNQFLEIFLENGLIGLLLFLSMFGMMFYIAIVEKNIMYLMFLLIVVISFLFETMLNRLAGISFFALFSFLLIHVKGNIIKSKVP